MMMYTVLANKAREKNTKTKEHTLFSKFFQRHRHEGFQGREGGSEGGREGGLRKDTKKDTKKKF